jgi:hypothetical protein
MSDIGFIYAPVHVLVCRDHPQMVYEFVLIVLSMKMYLAARTKLSNPYRKLSYTIYINVYLHTATLQDTKTM